MPAEKPEEVDVLFEQFVNEANLDSLVDLYEPGATLCIPPGQVAVGPEAIRAALQTMFDIGFRVKCNVTQTFIAGDIAACYNDWTGSAKGPDGNQMNFSGKAIEICRRQSDGTWKFAIDDPYARG